MKSEEKAASNNKTGEYTVKGFKEQHGTDTFKKQLHNLRQPRTEPGSRERKKYKDWNVSRTELFNRF